MGYGQSRRQVVAPLCTAALVLGACGSSAAPSEPVAPSPKSAPLDAGADTEALQIKAIADAINEFSPAVHTCWARAAADDFKLEGVVVLGLELLGEGAAKVVVAEDEVNDQVLTECLVSLWSDYQWPAVFAAGDRVQLPPFEFVAPEAQYVVSTDHVPVHTLAGGKLQVRVVLDEVNTGNEQAALSLLSIRDGMAVPLHTHSSAELLYVLAGGGELTGAGKPVRVGPGSAIYIPAGAVHGFEHKGQEMMEAVQLYAPGGPEARFKDPGVTAGTTPVKGKAPRRGPRASVRQTSSAPPARLVEGRGQRRTLFAEASGGGTEAELSALTLQPGAKLPPHRHRGASEYLYVLEGQAEIKMTGRVLSVHAGDAVQVPSGVTRTLSVAGPEEFKALQYFVPAGGAK